jgi:SAM-dependent methyltransferase
LAQDQAVAERDALEITTILGNMVDLCEFDNDSFDLIVHPCSNCFVPDVREVWREAYRVLRPGGCLLSGFSNGFVYLFDEDAMNKGDLKVAHSLPYSDLEVQDESRSRELTDEGRPIEFGHTLTDQIGGQLDAGFILCGFYEDHTPGEALAERVSTFIATRAVKRSGN